MPASVVPFSARRQGTYVLLEAALPERPLQTIGVLLADLEGNRCFIRMRQRYEELADPEDAEVLEALEQDMRERAQEMGADQYLLWLEDSLSNAVRISERQAIAVDSFTRVLDRLYSQHVETVNVQPFVTHVPLFSLRAAAGHLGEDMPSAEEDWVRAPEGMRLAPDLFVAHVAGRSMEPRIPDGSLNLFRFRPVGSRHGKILLIQRFGALDETARYTIKRYTSKKVETGEDQWQHERIRLEPLNPEFEAWDVGPEDFAVVAEWLRVID
ncbi:MAG TPA: S24 family peptidase [Bryobacteraceae bacterium]|nr:S24 family peptidase [Bryobacteraceae bacterium]